MTAKEAGVAVSSSPRSKITPEREQEFYEAVLDEIRENGYEALTMEGVAARTRCSKSTLYRQWGSKPRLVVAALRSTRCVRFAGIDTGSLAGDLRQAARAAGDGPDDDTTLLHALAHAAMRDQALQKALRETLIEPEVAAVGEMIRRGVLRGELAADHPAAPFLAAQLVGVIRVRPMLEGRFADAEYLGRFVEHCVLPPLGLTGP
ncbi:MULTISPECIES: TetR/AcrR family transcriptional regulator [Streptomyces]|uniref:TetR family transcriptional regulator n=2 Tax=Streptomyces TaxID=1883 RepID=A0A0B5EFK3_STRA4|nr:MULTISPECIES: TetR/AcrR family transcriptional regulator [Streptomyces]AJE80793.1 TetR family transcriptional regulator [Streptomyces albus]AOU75104.1 TetR family transcriptional regulator [Streptomyces albus]AYN30911.1 TetR family transcriptional regulator [Streptomyces albus]NKI43749.1 TetR/AcrR family transcriptional regulator [Streptomyces physcomitrii]